MPTPSSGLFSKHDYYFFFIPPIISIKKKFKNSLIFRADKQKWTQWRQSGQQFGDAVGFEVDDAVDTAQQQQHLLAR